MYVAETFASLQGEGVLVGTPSYFIRTSGCNLRCRWCDTRYTSWEPEGRRRRIGELLQEVVASGLRHVVVTGGEPLLQRELPALVDCLRAKGLHVTVETAGTVAPVFACDLLSLSPKLSNSDPEGRWRARHEQLRSCLAPLRTLVQAHPEYQLKFVVREADDVAEALDLSARIGADRDRVLLMPEGATAVALADTAPRVVRWCVEQGLRYSPRLHVDLFGGGRGV